MTPLCHLLVLHFYNKFGYLVLPIWIYIVYFCVFVLTSVVPSCLDLTDFGVGGFSFYLR